MEKVTTLTKEHRIVSKNILQWIEAWLSDKQLAGTKTRTIQSYSEKIKSMVIFFTERGTDNIEDVSTETLREFFQYQKNLHNDGGLHAIYRVIRAFFRWYGEEINLPYELNPIKKIKINLPNPDKLDPYTHEEINQLLLASKDDLLANLLIRFLFDTGIRISELLNLKLDNYDSITGDIQLPGEITKNSEKRYLHVGQKTRRIAREFLSSRTDNCPFLFITDEEEQYTYTAARGKMETIFNRAGVNYHGFHGFRRAWFDDMVMAGGQNIYGMQLLGGWKDVKTPERYFKIKEKEMQILASRHSPVDTLLSSVKKK